MKKHKPIFVLIMLVLLVFLLKQSAPAWHTPIKIAGQSGVDFFDYTGVRFNSQGQIFVVYKEGTQINLSKYNGESVSFVRNVSESSLLCYAPYMIINSIDEIHIIWAECSTYNSDTQYIKYRYFNGSWSPVITIITLDISGSLPGGYTSRKIDTMRMGMDSNKNMFIVFQANPETRSWLVSRYGTQVILEPWVVTQRHKFPDIAVDDSLLHVVWAAKLSGDGYNIKYASKVNARKGKWGTPIDVKNGEELSYSSHWPRITLDGKRTPHVIYGDDATPNGGGRNTFYRYLAGSRFSERFLVTGNGSSAYANIGISISNSIDNMIIINSIPPASRIMYNWKVNGEWTGNEEIRPMVGKPDNEAVDLSRDGKVAAISCTSAGEAVYLIVSDDVNPGPNLPPKARFSFSPNKGPFPLKVSFNASASTDADGQIVSYLWDFGDGTTGSGVMVEHVFKSKNRFQVALTVIDNNGSIGTASDYVDVFDPNLPPVARFSLSPSQGLYPLNVTFNASASSDSDGKIVSYHWDFGDGKKGSGSLVEHIYQVKKRFRISLTVTDDDGATATATGEVEVFGISPPLNVQYTLHENRNLFSVEYLYRINWDANPRNEEVGAKIVSYKIYRREPGQGGYSFFASMQVNNQGQCVYLDRTLGSLVRQYEYVISSVDSAGRESDTN